MNILRAIRRQRAVNRAYANGYDQGRFDERMEIADREIPCPCIHCMTHTPKEPAMTNPHTEDCTDCGCDETCTAPLPPEIHEHTKVCFATGCPAIREAHQQQAWERFARVQAAVARELDALGLTPGPHGHASMTAAPTSAGESA